jgi:hypothetical protein
LPQGASVPSPAEKEDKLWRDQFLFFALGEKTKLIPTFFLGKRTETNTQSSSMILPSD